MSKWSEGYYKAAIVGGNEITVEELVEFSIAFKMRKHIMGLLKSVNNSSGSNRMLEITTPLSFTKFSGNPQEYWDGYSAALVDLLTYDKSTIRNYEENFFIYYKDEIARSLKGFINRNARIVKNSQSDFQKETAGKSLAGFEAVSVEFSGLTLEDLLSIE